MKPVLDLLRNHVAVTPFIRVACRPCSKPDPSHSHPRPLSTASKAIYNKSLRSGSLRIVTRTQPFYNHGPSSARLRYISSTSKQPRHVETGETPPGRRTSSQPRVLIFGTGSIGSIYAFILSRANCHITAICRSNYSAIKSAGLSIQSSHYGSYTVHPDIVARSIEEAISQDPSNSTKPYDYILVTSKSFPHAANPSQASLLTPAVTPGHTAIALVQNGITIEPPYSTLFPNNPLLSCVAYLPVTQTSPGTFVHKDIEQLHIGTYPAVAPAEHKAAASRLVDLVSSGGATAHLHDDIQAERWQKLLVNASWNPVCALTRCRDAEFLSSSTDHSQDLSDSPLEFIESIMSEIAFLAQRSGYPQINHERVSYQLSRAQARIKALDEKTGRGGVEPSMLADVLGARNLEVDAIIGNAVRVAGGLGVDGKEVRLLRTLWVLARALDGSFYR